MLLVVSRLKHKHPRQKCNTVTHNSGNKTPATKQKVVSCKNGVKSVEL